MIVVLMPLSKYKKLYSHVIDFELADPKLFKDAVITENLSICSLKKENVDKYTWQDLVLKSVDQRYIEFYKWNIEHNKGLVAVQQIYKGPEEYCQDTDFIDTSRCVGRGHGDGYHAKNTSAYKWNNFINGYENGWLSGILVIKFPSRVAKDNYCKYVYNWATDKYACLESKVMGGLNISSVDKTHFFWTPQIDWENIHINQKELWNKGDYDNAVLSEMGLKWNTDKTVIVKDE